MSNLSKIWLMLQGHDPNRINLRKAARACILAPATFFLLQHLLVHPTAAAFGFLSCFCHLVFANFGGPRMPRACAYAASVALTTLVVAAGSSLADTTAWAALGMFALMFAAIFATTLGGYAPAFVSPLALAFACSIFIPLDAINMSDRLMTWSFGGLVALCGGVFLWPRDARATLQGTLADIIAVLSRTIRSWADGQDGSADFIELESKLFKLRANIEVSPLRPTATAARDIGLLHMVESLIAAAAATKKILSHGMRDIDRDLAMQMIAGLPRAEAVLRGDVEPDVMRDDIELLNNTLQDSRERMRTHLKRLGKGQVDEALEGLQNFFPVLVLARLVLWIQIDAAQARGLDLDAPEAEASSSRGPVGFTRIRAIFRTHLDFDGIVFRNALRAATGFALGVLVAKTVPTGHGFWVVLGVASILRTSAASTTVTALQAIFGTLLGFVAAAIVVLTFDDSPVRLIWLVPPLVFLAAYSPGALGLTVGQMAFTILVVVVFSIVKPAGLEIDIARVETISLGAACAAIVGFLMWPRGARAELARCVAEVFVDASQALQVALADEKDARQAAAGSLQAARQRARAAFVTALGERGEKLNAPDWASLSRPPAMTFAFLQGLLPPYPSFSFEAGELAANAVREQCTTVSDRLTFVSQALQHRESGNTLPERLDTTQELRACLKACLGSHRSTLPDVLALISWSYWLMQLDDAIDEAAGAVDSLSGAAAPRAWLRWD